MNNSISIHEASTLNTIAQTPRAHQDVRKRLVKRLDKDRDAHGIGMALLKALSERDAADQADKMATDLEEWVGAKDEAVCAEVSG